MKQKRILCAVFAAFMAMSLTACTDPLAPKEPSDETASVAPQDDDAISDNAAEPEEPTLDDEPDATTEPSAQEPTPEPEPEPEPVESNPLMAAALLTSPVNSGSGESIGRRAYIKISKETLKTVTNEQYADFVKKRVENSGNNWVSIICDDGTGICFVGSMGYIADYGELDSEGAIVSGIGTIMLTENGYKYEAS